MTSAELLNLVYFSTVERDLVRQVLLQEQADQLMASCELVARWEMDNGRRCVEVFGQC